ncbi:MAG: sigma-70 family RNA polymerase sigma factor [Candidatus Latescibacteria bacterium]|nr:sigma-70 family RNA polymerase sigma factor [Candidatus Latescibacterota bacterium]
MTAFYSDNLVGQYFKDIEGSVGVSAQTEAQLAAQIQAGDEEALHQLVQANLRFVVHVAKQYQNQGLPLTDLINEGNLGLAHAARRFDGTKGHKFITYAVWWIRQAILQALAEQTRLVRVPPNRISDAYKLNQTLNPLAQRLGRSPRLDEIAEELDLPSEEVDDLLNMDHRPLSLDTPTEEEESTWSYSEVLADETQPAPDQDYWTERRDGAIEAALDSLNPRERQVVRLYFGFNGCPSQTLEAIGGQLGCTRERVRQIREQALSKLRSRSRNEGLKAYQGSTAV